MTWWGWTICLPPFFLGWIAVIAGFRALRVARRISEQARLEVMKAKGLLDLNEGLFSELQGHAPGPDDPVGRRF